MRQFFCCASVILFLNFLTSSLLTFLTFSIVFSKYGVIISQLMQSIDYYPLNQLFSERYQIIAHVINPQHDTVMLFFFERLYMYSLFWFTRTYSFVCILFLQKLYYYFVSHNYICLLAQQLFIIICVVAIYNQHFINNSDQTLIIYIQLIGQIMKNQTSLSNQQNQVQLMLSQSKTQEKNSQQKMQNSQKKMQNTEQKMTNSEQKILKKAQEQQVKRSYSEKLDLVFYQIAKSTPSTLPQQSTSHIQICITGIFVSILSASFLSLSQIIMKPNVKASKYMFVFGTLNILVATSLTPYSIYKIMKLYNSVTQQYWDNVKLEKSLFDKLDYKQKKQLMINSTKQPIELLKTNQKLQISK